MSRTEKEGKRWRYVHVRAEPAIKMAISARHTFGSTEKILRRNRKTWTRLVNKRRRAIDAVAVRAGEETDP